MSVWNAETYDSERRRLVPCFEELYGTTADLVSRCVGPNPRVLDLGAGTGILSATILERVPSARLTLLDASAAMLRRAEARLAQSQPKILLRSLAAELPPGPFDAVVSALAIHHLSDEEKRLLYGRILKVLSPGGLFANAEQVAGKTERLEKLFEASHLDASRKLGSSEEEIAGAIERMKCDKCATLADQLAWLEQAGYRDVECFLRWFRFAVFGGWKPD